MPLNLIIRPYQKSDRPILRDICCDTANLGGPMESFFFDRQVFADLGTLYYTDFEPQSTWVAQVDQQVVGYLMGCLDTRRYLRITSWPIVPRVLLKAVIRGVFLRRQTWRFLGAAFKSLSLGGFKRHIPLEQYPAHLHIDLKADFRGQGIGGRLIEKFILQAKTKGLKGIHLTTREDNFSGRKFFEKNGFRLLDSYPVFMPQGNTFKLNHSLVYAMAFHEDPG